MDSREKGIDHAREGSAGLNPLDAPLTSRDLSAGHGEAEPLQGTPEIAAETQLAKSEFHSICGMPYDTFAAQPQLMRWLIEGGTQGTPAERIRSTAQGLRDFIFTGIPDEEGESPSGPPSGIDRENVFRSALKSTLAWIRAAAYGPEDMRQPPSRKVSAFLQWAETYLSYLPANRIGEPCASPREEMRIYHEFMNEMGPASPWHFFPFYRSLQLGKGAALADQTFTSLAEFREYRRGLLTSLIAGSLPVPSDGRAAAQLLELDCGIRSSIYEHNGDFTWTRIKGYLAGNKATRDERFRSIQMDRKAIPRQRVYRWIDKTSERFARRETVALARRTQYIEPELSQLASAADVVGPLSHSVGILHEDGPSLWRLDSETQLRTLSYELAPQPKIGMQEGLREMLHPSLPATPLFERLQGLFEPSPEHLYDPTAPKEERAAWKRHFLLEKMLESMKNPNLLDDESYCNQIRFLTVKILLENDYTRKSHRTPYGELFFFAHMASDLVNGTQGSDILAGADAEQVNHCRRLWGEVFLLDKVNILLQEVSDLNAPISTGQPANQTFDRHQDLRVQFGGSQGLLRQLSGYILEACWVDRNSKPGIRHAEKGVFDEKDNIFFVPFTTEDGGQISFQGGSMVMLCYEPQTEAPVFIVFAFQPSSDLLRKIYVGDLFEAFVQYLKSVNLSDDSQQAVTPRIAVTEDSAPFYRLSNCPEPFHYIRDTHFLGTIVGKVATEKLTHFFGKKFEEGCVREVIDGKCPPYILTQFNRTD